MNKYFVVSNGKCPYCEGAGTTIQRFSDTNRSTGRRFINERDVICTNCNGTGKALIQTPLIDALKEMGIEIKEVK